MRWDASGTRFARPVRWLVCLFGSEPVRFRFGEIEACRETRGLRHAGPTSFSIPSADAYEETLKKHGIIPDPVARRAAIEAELAKLAASVSGEPVPDEVLLTEATGITESPELLLCSYDRAYLDLPAEVLVTSFREHQRCFAIRKTGDSPPERSARGTVPVLPLLPHFVAVTNTPGCDHRSVTGWYEKAAESRLRDARFFVESDLKRGLEALVADEKQVVWIEGMGSYFDKTERLRALCRHLAAQVPDADASALDRAALLCKADLLTNMVREKEFTSLQGRMGGIYARLLGELEPVARAIAEHYLPNYSGDELPKTREGALLSIADKLDNIVATFLTGEIPTGSEDPFALRRQATGLLTVILERRLPVDVAALVRAGVAQFGNPKPEHAAQIPGLFRERLNALLADQGTPYDVASAVMETSWQEPAQAILRATALTAYRARPEFEKLIIGQKRVANILKGLPRLSAEENRGCTEPQDALLTEPTEKLLWREARTVEPDLDRCLAAHDYSRAFELLLSLRPTIDRFFDDVLVMAEDKEQRANRLSLLNCVRNLFGKVADLSRIVIAGE
jgi:glycyl-tRNA synthetase beta chain